MIFEEIDEGAQVGESWQQPKEEHRQTQSDVEGCRKVGFELLANKERVSDSLVFPARGLTLYRVDYPTNDQLLERAKVTIGKRDGSGQREGDN